jgi:hypothetical protein
MRLTGPKSFSKAGIASFPYTCRKEAELMVYALAPFVDDDYRKKSMEVFVQGESVQIPSRIHFIESNVDKINLHENLLTMAHCLHSRSTDGYLRHTSLRRILPIDESWTIPFITILAGEYVIEIIQEMVGALPMLNRIAYTNFLLENRPLVAFLRAKATSYWYRYYRHLYVDKNSYPGLVFLHQLERWAN